MIVITGCGGYIGAHLARALRAQGRVVRGLDSNAASLSPLADLGVETIAADVRDVASLRAALIGVEIVYHLAGSALGRPPEIVQTNVAGARNIAACVAESGARALIFAGSGALYPSGPDWLDESTPPAPAFSYARAKFLAEQALLEARARNGVPVMIARIAGVYGPEGPALMLGMVRRGMFPLIGGGKGYASYIHIDDLVAALLALPERGRPGQIYNLADDEPVKVHEFYGHLATLLGAPPPPHISPMVAGILVSLVSLVAQLRRRPAPLPTDLVQMAAVSHRMRNRRMRDELGITLRYPSYREGLPTCVNIVNGQTSAIS